MDGFWKAAAVVLVTVILALALGKQELALLLTLASGCMVIFSALSYLEPVLDLLRELERLINVPGEILEILLKAVGVALTSEVIAKICTDGGTSSLGKSMEILGSSVILFLSIPVMRSLLKLIQDILGAL